VASGKSRRCRVRPLRSNCGKRRRMLDLRFLGTVRSSPRLVNGPIVAVAVGSAYGNSGSLWITSWPVDNPGFVGAG
jgi:hypothetical protein